MVMYSINGPAVLDIGQADRIVSHGLDREKGGVRFLGHHFLDVNIARLNE